MNALITDKNGSSLEKKAANFTVCQFTKGIENK